MIKTDIQNIFLYDKLFFFVLEKQVVIMKKFVSVFIRLIKLIIIQIIQLFVPSSITSKFKILLFFSLNQIYE